MTDIEGGNVRANKAILALGITLAAVMQPVVAHAQQAGLRPGDTAWVVDDTNQETMGVVQSADASGLTMSVGGVERRWELAGVREVWRREDSTRNGKLLGLGIGAGAGIVVGSLLATWFEYEGHDGTGIFMGMLALGAGSGFGIGAGVDALHQGRTAVYRRGRVRLDVAPVLSKQARVVKVGISF
jgi:hypothetical protein